MSWTLTYKLTDAQDGYIVTGYSTTSTEPVDEVVIPDTYNELPVVEIARRAFYNQTNLIKLTLGANIKVISTESISMCPNLSDILLNNGLEIISSMAIYNCSSLTSLTIPVSVSTIYRYPFSSCTNLSTVYFNAEYARVDSNSYYSRIWDTSSNRQLDIIIGSSVKILAKCIFYDAYINSIIFEVPSSVAVLEDYALSYHSNSNCKTLILPESCLSIGSSAIPTKLDYIKFPDAIEILDVQGLGGSNFVWKQVILPNNLKAFTPLSYLYYMYESTEVLLNTSDDYPGIGYLGSTDNPYLMAVAISDINLTSIELHPDTVILAMRPYTPTWKSWLANGTTHSLILNAKLEFISALYEGNSDNMFSGDTYTATDIISSYGTTGLKYIAGRRPDGTLNNHCFLESCGYELPTDWNTGLPTVAIDAECKFLHIGNVVPTIPDGVVQAFFHNGTPDADIAVYWSPSSQLRFVSGYTWLHSSEEILKRPATTIPANLLMANGLLLTLNMTELILPDSCICFSTDGLLPHIKKLYIGKKLAILDLMVRTNWGRGYSTSRKQDDIWNALQSITCSTDNLLYRAEANCLIAKASNKIVLGSNSASLPESVNGIAEFAFAGCVDITSINIPEHIKYVERDTFAYCPKLTSVSISKNTSLAYTELFKFCPSLQTISIAADHPTYTDLGCNLIAAKAEPNKLLVGCAGTRLLDTLTAIAAAAFVGSGITSLNLPDSVKTVGECAFEGCSSLATVNLGKISAISTAMLFDCSALTSITMSPSCNKIERLGFSNCSSLEQINLNDSLITSIGERAFENCTKLTTVNFPDSLSNLDANYIFYNCSSLKNLTIPNGVSKCANNTFYSCNLEQVTAPGAILNMLPKNSVKQITVNSESIPDNALANFTNLTSLTLEDTVKSIGNNVLTGCTGITSLTLPSNIESISNNAFTDNTSLQKITFEGNANRLRTIIRGTNWFSANTKVYTKEYKKIPVYIRKILQEF